MISAMKVVSILRKGTSQCFWVNLEEAEKEERSILDIPIIREFEDVFPKELPGPLPDRQLEFPIDLEPGAAPVSKAPYRMAPNELQELKVQLQELLDLGIV